MYLFFDDLSQTWGLTRVPDDLAESRGDSGESTILICIGPDSTRGLLSPIRLGWAGFGFVDFLTHALYKRRKRIDVPSQEQDILELWELWSHQIYEPYYETSRESNQRTMPTRIKGLEELVWFSPSWIQLLKAIFSTSQEKLRG